MALLYIVLTQLGCSWESNLIRVVYVVSTLSRCGPTNQLLNIVRGLDRCLFDPILITLSPEGGDSMWEEFEHLSIQMYSLGLSRIGGLMFARSRLTNLIAQMSPCLVHTQGIRADTLLSKTKIGIPRVSTVRNFPDLDYIMTYGSFVGRVMVFFHVRALRRLDLCVGVSRAVTENLRDKFSINHTHTIPNGVDSELFAPVSKSKKAQLRLRLGFSESAKIWLVSGGLIERKDPLFIISAWKRLIGDDMNCLLVFVGDGGLETACISAAKGHDNIVFLGRVKSVAQYLQESDFYLSASKAEGLPNSALEALSCGLPVLLSNIDPHEELIGMDFGIGTTYKIDDVISFGAGVDFLLEGNYSSKRDACLRLVGTHLSASVMSKKYQDVYQRLLSKV